MDLYKVIQTMAQKRGWSDSTVQTLLCRFIEDKGFYKLVIEFLNKEADYEEDASLYRDFGLK